MTTLLFGFLFGALLQSAKLNRFDTFSGMAGGCTSGHVISGGMQLAASSLLFALFVFAGLLLTGKLFYTRK